MRRKLIGVFLFNFLFAFNSIATTVIINTGTAGTAAYNAGPIYRSSASSAYNASHYAYLYTQSELAAAGITVGAIISEVGWVKNNNATTQSGAKFRIFMKNTSASNFSAASETWTNLNTGATKVFEDLNYAVPATMNPNYITFTFSTPFTYTGGSLEISTEWDINGVSGNPSTAALDWMWSTVTDRIYGVGATALTGAGTLSSTTNSISTIDDRRPFIQIVYTGSNVPPACITSPLTPVNNSTTVCSGNTVLRWNKAINATGYDVLLNTGTGTPVTVVSTNQPDTFYNVTTTVGPYTWKVIPRNASGSATGCNNWNFTTLPSITPDVSIVVSPKDSLCGNATATFTATPVNGGNNPAYKWFKNNTLVGTNNPVYVDNVLANNDIIKVVLTSNAPGCLTSATDTSNVIKMTILPNPRVSITASGPTAFCYGGTVRLDAPGSGQSYQWMHNGMPLAGATSDSYTVTYSGSYKVKIVTSAFCPSISDSIDVIVYPTPFPLVDRNGNVLKTAASYTSYQWYRNNQPIAGETTNSMTISRDGRYKVVVTDITNCGGSSVDVPVNSMSIPSVSAKDIQVYPNPASSQVTIQAPIKTDIVLKSLDGKTVLSAKQVNGIDISPLAAGIYILYLSDHNGQLLKTEKLVRKQD